MRQKAQSICLKRDKTRTKIKSEREKQFLCCLGRKISFSVWLNSIFFSFHWDLKQRNFASQIIFAVHSYDYLFIRLFVYSVEQAHRTLNAFQIETCNRYIITVCPLYRAVLCLSR